jgi:hypothetical protein
MKRQADIFSSSFGSVSISFEADLFAATLEMRQWALRR